MKKSFFLAGIIILGVLQVTLLDYFKIFTIKPDLLLLSMVVANLSLEFKWAFTFSVFSGILKDAFGGLGLGLNSLLFGAWSLIILRISKELTLDSNMARVVLTFIVAFLHNLITGLIFISLGRIVPFGIFFRAVSLGAIYTTGILFLLFKVNKTPFLNQTP